MRALCLSVKKIWHPLSRTLLTQEFQNVSAVFNSGKKLAPRSHFTGLRRPKKTPEGATGGPRRPKRCKT